MRFAARSLAVLLGLSVAACASRTPKPPGRGGAADARPSSGLARATSAAESIPLEIPAPTSETLQELRDLPEYWVLASAGGFFGAAAGAVPFLVAEVEDSTSRARLQAILALGSIGPGAGSAVPALIAALGQPDLRQHAVRALGAIGPAAKPAIAALRNVDASSDPWLRLAVRDAVRRIEGLR